jgi:hypothetical protein
MRRRWDLTRKSGPGKNRSTTAWGRRKAGSDDIAGIAEEVCGGGAGEMRA